MLALALNRELRTPLQLQIFQFYSQVIQRGGLLCDDKLPSTREQAQVLNVAKTAIMMAYGKLMTVGLTKNRHGIGYEVISTMPVCITPTPVPVIQGSPPTKPKVAGVSIDVYAKPGRECYYRMGVPDPSVLPWPSWRKWNNAPNMLREQLFTQHHSPDGLFSLREQLVRYPNLSCGINIQAENIIITNGIQEGLSLLS